MSEAATAGVSKLADRALGSRTISYDERDAILYALAIGASADELDLVYERELRVLPTFGLTLALWAVEAAGELGAYDPVKTLHVGQDLRVREALPPAGEIEIEAAITAVWDKGSAALLEISAESEYFQTTYQIFVPGAGGFGGERGRTRPGDAVDRPADRTQSLTTSPTQAALYRMTGDGHPLHIDPEVATTAGFDRPILHGLCTLGTVTASVSRAVGRRPWEVAALSARFAAAVYPGSSLEIEIWSDSDAVHFAAACGESLALKDGCVSYGEDGR
jgi:acyl dehydratase